MKSSLCSKRRAKIIIQNLQYQPGVSKIRKKSLQFTVLRTLHLTEQVKGARLLNLPFAKHTLLEDMPESVLPFLQDFITRVTI
jgi:hypothetical protein